MDTLSFSKAQIEKRVARFADLKPAGDLGGQLGALPDDLISVIMGQKVYGLTSPSGEGDRNFWDSAAVPAGVTNFGAVVVRCRAGRGPGWHVHRYSYENFMALQGPWRVLWNAPGEEEHVDLNPFDMVSIPPGAIRRFEYIGEGEGALLAFAYAGAHSIADPDEIWMPPCEIDRIADAVEDKGGVYADFVGGMRRESAKVSAAVTDADRAFTRRVAEDIAAE